ncbi:MAG TPA: hypothetical protein IAA02_02500 [Candidatus Sutterella merdavium]|nr:hypothetical protein [Candidatus Sutterella merdavium]
MGVHRNIDANFLRGVMPKVPSKKHPYENFGMPYVFLWILHLRNYGVTVKEMNGVLTGNSEDAVAFLDERAGDIRESVRRLNGLLEAHEELKTWFARRRSKPIDWEIREVEPYYFLPHTNTQSFRKDEAIYELVKTWGMWLPVTKSALTVEPTGVPSDPEALHWGFAIPKSKALRYELPVNQSVESLHFGKAFVYHFSELEDAFNMADIAERNHPVFTLIRELGFHVVGTGLLINEMKFQNDEKGLNQGTGRFILPISCALRD